MHWTQRSFEHFGLAAGQSTFVTHSTQVDRAVSHLGVAPEQFASVVQPGTHPSKVGWHTGVAPPQSLFPRHSTQRPSLTQWGADAGQSVDAPHWTHVRLVLLHTARGDAQSALVRQPKHAPEAESQYGAMTGGHPAAPGAEHEARHWWPPGQHAGALAPQSPLLRHATQAPDRQNLVAPPQSESTRQSTQPSVGSHLAFAPHALALAQTLPAGMPFELFELHAAATTRPKVNATAARLASEERGRLRGRIEAGPEQRFASGASAASVACAPRPEVMPES
jgi:hypothetical protein